MRSQLDRSFFVPKKSKGVEATRQFVDVCQDVSGYHVVVLIYSANQMRLSGVRGHRFFGPWHFGALEDFGHVAESLRNLLAQSLASTVTLVTSRYVDVDEEQRAVGIGYAILASEEVPPGISEMVLQFLSGICDLPLESDLPASPLQHGEDGPVQSAANRFLTIFGGKNIKYPCWVGCGGRTGYLLGRYRPSPPRPPVEDVDFKVVGRVDTLAVEGRAVTVHEASGRMVTFNFDFERYWDELHQMHGNSIVYTFCVMRRTLPDGVIVDRLASSPTQVNMQLDGI